MNASTTKSVLFFDVNEIFTVKAIKRFGIEYYGVFYRGTTLLKTRNSEAHAKSDVARFKQECNRVINNYK